MGSSYVPACKLTDANTPRGTCVLPHSALYILEDQRTLKSPKSNFETLIINLYRCISHFRMLFKYLTFRILSAVLVLFCHPASGRSYEEPKGFHGSSPEIVKLPNYEAKQVPVRSFFPFSMFIGSELLKLIGIKIDNRTVCTGVHKAQQGHAASSRESLEQTYKPEISSTASRHLDFDGCDGWFVSSNFGMKQYIHDS